MRLMGDKITRARDRRQAQSPARPGKRGRGQGRGRGREIRARGRLSRSCSRRPPAAAARACAGWTPRSRDRLGVRGRVARGLERVRRRLDVRREADSRASSRRDPGFRRRQGQGDPSGRARVLDPAPAPESLGRIALADSRAAFRRRASRCSKRRSGSPST